MKCPKCEGKGKVLYLELNPMEKTCPVCDGKGQIGRFINEFVPGYMLDQYLTNEPYPEYRLAGMTSEEQTGKFGIPVQGYRLVWERKEQQ
jgi:RecJ-like exonuclease